MTQLELAVRAKRGDAEAFALLVTNQQESLYRIAYSYTKNREDALEVVSEAVYRGLVSVRRLKQPEYFHTWLTRILINCAVDHVRKTRRTVYTDADLTVPKHSSLPREELIDLFEAVGQLEERQKTVVLLKYLSDLTLEQVAEVMQCPVGTVKTHLHKALKELRLELKEDRDAEKK